MLSALGETSFKEFYRRAQIGGGLLYTLYVSQNIGKTLGFLAYRLRMSPNAVSFGSLAAALLGALVVLTINNPLVAGTIAGLLWQLSYALDCADGILARFLKKSSSFGAWLDVLIDRTNTIVVVFALFSAQVIDVKTFLFFALTVIPMLAFGWAINLKAALLKKKDEGDGVVPKRRGLAEQLALLPADTGVQFLVLSLAYALGHVMFVGVLLGAVNLLMLGMLVFTVHQESERPA